MENKSSAGCSIGVLEIIAVVFITLKLSGVVNWSWWWVLAPIWGQFAILGCCVVFVAVVALFYLLVDWR